jgi:hypothetical protein
MRALCISSELGGMNKVEKLDVEPWKFIVYEVDELYWFVSFSYSPVSFVDLSMIIKLTDEEKINAELDRQFLIDFSDKLRNDYKPYLIRSVEPELRSKLQNILKNT